jgi:polysaccharide pyruvyl transferase WcaK-like protein
VTTVPKGDQTPFQAPSGRTSPLSTGTGAPTRLALLSPSGLGNLGDAAILQALIHGIRRRIPDAELVGLTLHPRDTLERHGISAFTCSGISLHGYGVCELPGDTDGMETRGPEGQRNGPLVAIRAQLRRLVAAAPGGKHLWRAGQLLRDEANHRRRMNEALPTLAAVVVAGGGQLDEYWGGPFGHPYALWRWARFAKRRNARFLVLSVGTGTLSSVAARSLVLPALATAEYRSFRDAESRRLVGDAQLTRDDPVVPDLAFSYPLGVHRPASAIPVDRRVAAVSPMIFHHPRIWPKAESARYDRHLDGVGRLVERLLDDRWNVVLFPSDKADRVPIQELMNRLASRCSGDACQRLLAPAVATAEDLIALLRGADVVVAARLHGVLLSHVVGRPVLALAHDRKVAQQMADMRQTEFCVDIDEFEPEHGHRLLTNLWMRRRELGLEIAALAAEFRRRVETQYDTLFGMPQRE